jgi:hypothetical protein
MHSKSFTTTFLFLLLVFISCRPEKSKSDFDKFTGRWSLHIVESQKDSTSSWEPRLGNYENRQGYILYDGIEGMGVHHVTDKYEKYEFEGKGSLDSLTQKDLRHMADNFVYFGSYKVNEEVKTIEHHIESANFQRMWGTVATRKYEFSGDTLILYPVRDTYPISRLKWVRINRE